MANLFQEMAVFYLRLSSQLLWRALLCHVKKPYRYLSKLFRIDNSLIGVASDYSLKGTDDGSLLDTLFLSTH